MSISNRLFGFTADGRAVTCWCLAHASGAAVEILDLGATTRSVRIPDGCGDLRSVCMGFDTVKEYEESDAYSGAIVGRHAGRIRGGSFELGEAEHQLSRNHGAHHHHGGFEGFSHKLWQVTVEGEKLIFSHTSPDGEEGYPGTLTVTATYEWTGERTLTLTLNAVCDRDTVASFTHHGYWNLSGEETIGNHSYQVHAPTFAAADEEVLPTGALVDVCGTAFDFRTSKLIGCPWNEKEPHLIEGCGYDHTFPVPDTGLRELGALSAAGLKLTVSSTLPALHIYTGKYTHAALEAQFIPDAVHHPNFPSTVLPAGQQWHHVIVYQFTNLYGLGEEFNADLER